LGDEYKAEQRLRNTDGKEIAPSAGKGGTRSEGAVEDVKGRSGKGDNPTCKTEELRQVVAFVKIAFTAKFLLRKGATGVS
jgi:hypothetical protein